MKIGLEVEGVFTLNGRPIRAPVLFGKPINDCDSYDVCAEVRTQAIPLRRVSDVVADLKGGLLAAGDLCAYEMGLVLLQNLLFYMDRVQQAARARGGDVTWDEMLIPEYIHREVMDTCSFKNRTIHNALTGVDTTTKHPAAGRDDRYRGGGMHINISGVPNGAINNLVKQMTNCIHHPSTPEEGLPFRSLYRARGLWREVNYPDWTSGFEYRSTCFSLTPLGIKHYWRVILRTVYLLRNTCPE